MRKDKHLNSVSDEELNALLGENRDYNRSEAAKRGPGSSNYRQNPDAHRRGVSEDSGRRRGSDRRDSGRGAAGRSSDGRDFGRRDASGRSSDGRDPGRRDAGGRSSDGRDSGRRDSGGRNSDGRDSGRRDAGGRGAEGRRPDGRSADRRDANRGDGQNREQRGRVNHDFDSVVKKNADLARERGEDQPRPVGSERDPEYENLSNLTPKEIRKLEKKEKKKRNRNKIFARVTYLFVALFLVLMGYIGYFEVFRAGDIVNSPYNPRKDAKADQVVRGSILSCNGDILAHTVTAEDGSSYREYPFGNVFAHVVGYNSNGKAGLESSENDSMLTSNAFIGERITKELQNEKNQGDNVITTLDSNLQWAAWNALGENRGAVVAIEPSTGAVKAMVSKPDFDPNAMGELYDSLNTDEVNSPLLNRATMGMYPPGSTFKIVTALEYIREFGDYASYYYNCFGSITQGETTISCFDGTVHGEQDLIMSFANSCNSSFANIGMNLDGTAWRSTCEELLFNNKLPGSISAAKPQFTVDATAGYATKMMTGMGQGETLTNPYHMAMIVSAIANGGTLMKPYLVDRVENYSGTVVSQNTPEAYGKLMETSEAAVLTEFMKAVVEYGTATELYNEWYSVAGKTGTAEYSDDKSQSHSWFVGFSNVDNPDLVVAVIVEGYDGNPDARSIPIANAVFAAYHQ